jgi:hypothetical protein
MLERCRRGARGWSALALLSMLTACQDAETRPQRALDCNDAACIDTRGNGVRLPPPAGNGAGAGGGAGSGNMPDPGDGTLAGTVREILSSDLGSSQSLQGQVEVRVSEDLTTETGAGGMFRLDGIERGATLWVGVGNFEDPPAEPFIDTLQAVDSARSNVVDLLVIRRDVLRDVAAQSFLNGTVELDPARAHIVLRFVEEGGTPLEGVRLTLPDPAQVSTAYDNGDGYSDALEATSTRGMVVLLNHAAARYPGTPTGIVAELDDQQFTTELRIAAGAVTVVTAVVPDP